MAQSADAHLQALCADFAWIAPMRKAPDRLQLLTSDGELLEHDGDQIARSLTKAGRVLVLCHHLRMKAVIRPHQPCADVMELFAFVYPARLVAPTLEGLMEAMAIAPSGHGGVDLRKVVMGLLQQVPGQRNRKWMCELAATMKRAGWLWADAVIAMLGSDPKKGEDDPLACLKIWHQLREWEDQPPGPPAGHKPVGADEACEHLRRLTGEGSEQRPQQFAYAKALTHSFKPRIQGENPPFTLAQAGTGIGKTRAYLAPSMLWGERNGGTVWLSTFTRQLQHQIMDELGTVFPDKADFDAAITMRKGRENYLCLLNLEEAIAESAQAPRRLIALVLMVQWLATVPSGDLTSNRLPAWMPELLGRDLLFSLADAPGECIHNLCPHWRRCLIEVNRKQADQTRLVAMNHALLMTQFLQNRAHGRTKLPERLVLDEAHHLLSAADQAFAIRLSARYGGLMRRWLLGEGQSATGFRRKSRGLRMRLDGFIETHDALEALERFLLAASALLPSSGVIERLDQEAPNGPCERFLMHIRQHVYAQAGPNCDHEYDLEAGCDFLSDTLLASARELEAELARLVQFGDRLIASLEGRDASDGDQHSGGNHQRLNLVCHRLRAHVLEPIKGWQAMVGDLCARHHEPQSAQPNDRVAESASRGSDEPKSGFFDGFVVTRNRNGRDSDIGMHRHWIDPLEPFARQILAKTDGAVITSASLLDGDENGPDSHLIWNRAKARVGLNHVEGNVETASFDSPFDYANQARVYLINDVDKNNPARIAQALMQLFQASDGGGMALFTAIRRLRAVHDHLAPRMHKAGRELFAQHVDRLSLPSLIELFRSDCQACMLGTDALRDGIDIPGEALRLVAYDRTPWPRASLLHKARRQHFGGTVFDDGLVRLRLKQAFGRLIRQSQDRGVFVMLDHALPSRFRNAFPATVPIARQSLAETTRDIKAFFKGEVEEEQA
ncbi:MAG: ATP-dependent DNA helicase [Pseudomonadota bacterium]